ncbi:hypothetical protein [Paracoccus salsus]|uniref:hypothetical protein n=1 Tax=Paracoccus salsus TaxID=2911061 RepID=UPI001F48AB87|nr:hypothetical protein [Paracoccus salsus]
MEQIGAKAARFKELRKRQAFVRATAAANRSVAAFLLPKVGGAPAGHPPYMQYWTGLMPWSINSNCTEAENK